MTSAHKPGPKGPHGKPHVVAGTIREKAWRAMQIKGKFSLGDLCRAVLTGEEAGADPKNNIGRYVTGLTRTGVLVALKRRGAATSPTSNGEKRWLLLRDLGRQPPVVRGNGDVYDPNSGQVIALQRSPVAGSAHVE